eukprot:6188087-Pleurochrysis_carterae.AAC.2
MHLRAFTSRNAQLSGECCFIAPPVREECGRLSSGRSDAPAWKVRHEGGVLLQRLFQTSTSSIVDACDDGGTGSTHALGDVCESVFARSCCSSVTMPPSLCSP